MTTPTDAPTLPFDPSAPLQPSDCTQLDAVLYRFLAALAIDGDLHPRLAVHMDWYTDEVDATARTSPSLLRASHIRMLQMALAHGLWEIPADLVLGAAAEGRSDSGVAAEGLLLGGSV